eukprot:comp15752_c0_seq1/m.24356 comp15752_c0_seq1/g.24356  ORF comp15752_c0_seq1/g.24356 comp15752_c0_seq1/m.24356 type:complete len:102 (-) comp15752_c0_seq1:55-360(-)
MLLSCDQFLSRLPGLFPSGCTISMKRITVDDSGKPKTNRKNIEKDQNFRLFIRAKGKKTNDAKKVVRLSAIVGEKEFVRFAASLGNVIVASSEGLKSKQKK